MPSIDTVEVAFGFLYPNIPIQRDASNNVDAYAMSLISEWKGVYFLLSTMEFKIGHGVALALPAAFSTSGSSSSIDIAGIVVDKISATSGQAP